MGHDDIRGIQNGRIGDVLGVDARLENRPETRILAKRGIRIGLSSDDLTRAMIDGVGQQVAARLAFLETDARQRRQIDRAEHHDHHDDDRGDAGDLLRLDA